MTDGQTEANLWFVLPASPGGLSVQRQTTMEQLKSQNLHRDTGTSPAEITGVIWCF